MKCLPVWYDEGITFARGGWTETECVASSDWTETDCIAAGCWTETNCVVADWDIAGVRWTETERVSAGGWTEAEDVAAGNWTETDVGLLLEEVVPEDLRMEQASFNFFEIRTKCAEFSEYFALFSSALACKRLGTKVIRKKLYWSIQMLNGG